MDQERGLELIIGNNEGNTIIRYITRTEELVTAKTPDALSCSDSRYSNKTAYNLYFIL